MRDQIVALGEKRYVIEVNGVGGGEASEGFAGSSVQQIDAFLACRRQGTAVCREGDIVDRASGTEASGADAGHRSLGQRVAVQIGSSGF